MERAQSLHERRRGMWQMVGDLWRQLWPVLRQVIGWICIGLGLIGMALPLLQGIPLLVIGIALVGRRHPLIRWASVHLKLVLRRWAAVQAPVIGPLGRLALRAQQQISRQRRHVHWWYVEQKRLRAERRAAKRAR